jgi:transcription elongation factor Elf1
MTFTDFRCKHCGDTRAVSITRVVESNFIRCDACFAINALQRGERLALVNAASPDGPALRKRLISA